MLHRPILALAFLAAMVSSQAAAEQAPAPDLRPSGNVPHNCVTYYPEAAVRANAEGTTIMAFTVTSDGSVKDMVIDKSSGNADLDAATIRCVAQWHYMPAKRDGVAIETPWKAAIQWKLRGGSDYRLAARCAHYHALTAQMVTGIDGTTALTFRAMPDGTLSNVAVARSSGDASLDDAALRCLRDQHYTAAELDIPADGIPGHALMDWRSQYQRSIPLVPPFPPNLMQPAAIPHKPCTKQNLPAPPPSSQGKTKLQFTIATDGSVQDVSLKESSGSTPLDNAATACVATWRYMPAMDDGVPLAVQWTVEVDWRQG